MSPALPPYVQQRAPRTGLNKYAAVLETPGINLVVRTSWSFACLPFFFLAFSVSCLTLVVCSQF